MAEGIDQRISQLEAVARLLEPDAPQRAALRTPVLSYAEDFLDHIHQLPAYVLTEDKGIGIYGAPIAEEPIGIEEALRLVRHHIDRPGLNPASGGHLGYIPGGGIYTSALGDYLADIANRFAGLSYASPGAVHLENMLLQWMAGVVGYPETAGGNLTSGGSIANLVGIVTARDACALEARHIHQAVIYMTRQVHHSVDKAIRVAGLRECIIRYVPMDQRYRMMDSSLNEMIGADRTQGLKPWLIIASAGTTDTGAVDPLAAIADIAQNHHLWLHVDGAYGAFFCLCEEGRRILQGIERSDSLVMDPHKGLFLPYGSGAVIVRNREQLYQSFWYQANYLQDARSDASGYSPADLSPELTKHFRGLRLWLPLKIHGLRPFRAALEEKLLLARYFHSELAKLDGVEAGPYPDLSVVTYRFLPKRGDPDIFNKRLMQEVQRDGRVFLSSTLLGGKFTLRLAVLSFRTHRETIDLTLDILKIRAKQLEMEG